MSRCPISPVFLRSQTDESIFQRGEDYFQRGLVGSIEIDEQSINAVVNGSRRYRVRLHKNSKRFSVQCSCPYAQDGSFCKHAVAVGLAWLAQEQSPGQPFAGPTVSPQQMQEALEQYLSSRSQQELQTLVRQWASQHAALRQQLETVALRTVRPDATVAHYHQMLGKLLEPKHTLEYYEIKDLEERMHPILEEVQMAITPASATGIFELAETAMKRLQQMLCYADDSNGGLGGLLHATIRLLLQASLASRFEPQQMAERIFRWGIEEDLPLCSDHWEDCAELLGEEGLAHLRTLAEAWQPRPNENRESNRENNQEIFNTLFVRRLRRLLAERRGDWQELVALEALDLSHPQSYLRIAQLCLEHQQEEQALEWARRGWDAFAGRLRSQCAELLVELYHQRGLGQEALAVSWDNFAEELTLTAYQQLHSCASRLYCWESQRQRAVQHLQEIAGVETRALRRQDMQGLRARIALWEERWGEAYQEARHEECSPSLKLLVAKELEQAMPLEAIDLYVQAIVPLVEQARDHGYNAAIEVVRKTGKLMQAQNLKAEYAALLDELRAKFSRKRNFIGALPNK